jgi:GntR family transcriptional regulator
MAGKKSSSNTSIDFNIDHNSPLPLHVQVEGLLRKLIESPPYQNGKLLPREVELAKRLGISRNTIRQATNKLEHENLLVRKKGVGTRAVKKTVSTRLNNWLSFSDEMHSKGMESVIYDIRVSWVKAVADVKRSSEWSVYGDQAKRPSFALFRTSILASG